MSRPHIHKPLTFSLEAKEEEETLKTTYFNLGMLEESLIEVVVIDYHSMNHTYHSGMFTSFEYGKTHSKVW